MPTYQFHCDPDEKGCDHLVEVFCLYSQLEEKKPKSCPNCRKRKPFKKVLGGNPTLLMNNTLGMRVDKNSNKLSEDEKHHLQTKHNDYKDKSDGPAWVDTGERIAHRDEL